jgi:hypothetical protein
MDQSLASLHQYYRPLQRTAGFIFTKKRLPITVAQSKRHEQSVDVMENASDYPVAITVATAVHRLRQHRAGRASKPAVAPEQQRLERNSFMGRSFSY